MGWVLFIDDRDRARAWPSETTRFVEHGSLVQVENDGDVFTPQSPPIYTNDFDRVIEWFDDEGEDDPDYSDYG